MDYPKSVPSVGLVDGRFVDENPVAGTPGSLIPAVWGNSVTQEILSVITGGGWRLPRRTTASCSRRFGRLSAAAVRCVR